jgi:hypothetical protein
MIAKEDTAMPDTREASQRNLVEIFNRVVEKSKGKIKIEAKYPRWDEQLDTSAGTPKLHFYLLGAPEPHYLLFSRALFDNCADENNTEALTRAEHFIGIKLDYLSKMSHH